MARQLHLQSHAKVKGVPTKYCTIALPWINGDIKRQRPLIVSLALALALLARSRDDDIGVDISLHPGLVSTFGLKERTSASISK